MKKKVFKTLLFAVLMVGILVAIENCNGTREREDDLDVSLSEVQAQLAAFGTLSTTSVTTENTLSQDLSTFTGMLSQDDASLYYAEAPGSMGSIDQVAPMSLVPFFPTTDANGNQLSVAPPTYEQFYFAITNDGSAGLVIAGSNTVPTVATSPTPTITNGNDPFASPSPVDPTTIFRQRKISARRASVHNLKVAKLVNVWDYCPIPVKIRRLPAQTVTVSPTPVQTTTPTGPQINFVFVALNTGQQGSLGPAEFSDDDVWVSLMYNGTLQLDLHSYDIVNGDLADTVQFEVYQNVNGGDQYIGLMNLTEPQ